MFPVRCGRDVCIDELHASERLTMKKTEKWVVVRDTTGGGNSIYHHRFSHFIVERGASMRTVTSPELDPWLQNSSGRTSPTIYIDFL
jgi:hypothetical protein